MLPDPYDISKDRPKITACIATDAHDSTAKKNPSKAGKSVPKKKQLENSAIINQAWHNNYLLDNHTALSNKNPHRKISRDQMNIIKENCEKHQEAEKGNYKFIDHNYKPTPLGQSKILLIKTFNRYVNNPGLLKCGLSELVMLYKEFEDTDIIRRLFKSGIESLAGKKQKRTLKFRPFIGTLAESAPQPRDLGYYYKMPNGNSKIIHYLLRDNGFIETGSKNWTVYWHVGTPRYDLFQNLSSWQRVNQFPKFSEITRKDNLNSNIQRMQAKYGKAYHFMPKSHVLPLEISLFLHAHEQRKAEKKWYIIKPTASSQGRGISITNDIDEVTLFALTKKIDHQKK